MNPLDWIIWLFRKLFLVKEIISQDGVLHFRRYRLLSTPWFNIFIHKILKSDGDLHMHDHPWNFSSYILHGSYSEETTSYPYFKVVRTKIYSARSIVRHDAQDAHHLTLLTPVVWTLVFTSGRAREWGYRIGPEEWIDFRTYRQLKRAAQLPPVGDFIHVPVKGVHYGC